LHPSISISYGTVFFGNQIPKYEFENIVTPQTVVAETATGDNVGVLDLVT
jgi:hypothetical protein